MNDVGIITLNGKRGGFAIVDADVFEIVNQHRWQVDYRGYIVRCAYINGRNVSFSLHAEIVDGNPYVDHKNGIKLDNTRRNLRPATMSQNIANSKKHRDAETSSFKGVYYRKDTRKWSAKIIVHRREIYLGCFTSETEAAQAYNQAALAHFGEFARTNVF